MFTTASTSGLSITARQSVPVCSIAAEDLHDALDAGGIGIGRGGHAHEPVVGEEPQRGRVRLRDRAAADQAEPQRLPGSLTAAREKLGAASGLAVQRFERIAEIAVVAERVRAALVARRAAPDGSGSSRATSGGHARYWFSSWRNHESV